VAEHDNGYKLLFSHSAMVADLIRGFVHEDWVEALDFSTLEKEAGSYVSDGLRSRESDVVWRVRWSRDRWLYIYLLLEFQSTVDPFMGVRVMTYLGLLYQDLIRQRCLTASGKLPPVLPLVLYNGYARWGAALDVSELVEEVPGGIERYRPHLRYCLLDEGRIADAELESLQNLAAALFRLEKSRDKEDIEWVLTSLLEWLREPQLAEVRRAFTTWLVQVLLPARMPGAEIPQVTDLQEVRSMLAERVTEWTRQWKREGFEEGREEGLEKALAQARGALSTELEKRFGPLPEEARVKLRSIASIEEVVELSIRLSSAPSLSALGLC
jgi:predicted transposase/invertase (TIGR01784 family)